MNLSACCKHSSTRLCRRRCTSKFTRTLSFDLLREVQEMNRQQIEQEILKVLDEEQTAVGISGKLFTPDGLFSLLATSEEERRTLVQSELFKKSQKRFRELQFKEAEQFQQATS